MSFWTLKRSFRIAAFHRDLCAHPAGFSRLATRTSSGDVTNVSEVTGYEFSGALGGLVDLWVKTHAPVEQIRQIEALAETVFGDKDQVAKWLSEPNLATDEKAPITLLGDQSGFDRVKNLLLRIEYGVLA